MLGLSVAERNASPNDERLDRRRAHGSRVSSVTTPPTSQNDALRTFTAFPVAAVVMLVIIAAIAVARFSSRLGDTASAVCQGVPMTAGDTCERRGRRGRRFTSTYETMMAQSQASITADRIAPPVIVLIVAIAIVAVVIRWRRDTVLAASFAHEQPAHAHAARTSWRVVLWMILAALVIYLGSQMVLAITINARTLGYVLVGFVLLAGIGLAYAGRPKGSEYVGVYGEGARLARRGKVSGTPWSRLQYTPQSADGAGELRVVGETTSVTVPAAFGSDVGVATTNAWTANAWDRLSAGEVLDFGAVQLDRLGISEKGKAVVPYAELGHIASATPRKEGLHIYFYGRDGRELIDVSAGTIANPDALRWLLGQYCGVALPPTFG